MDDKFVLSASALYVIPQKKKDKKKEIRLDGAVDRHSNGRAPVGDDSRSTALNLLHSGDGEPAVFYVGQQKEWMAIISGRIGHAIRLKFARAGEIRDASHK